MGLSRSTDLSRSSLTEREAGQIDTLLATLMDKVDSQHAIPTFPDGQRLKLTLKSPTGSLEAQFDTSELPDELKSLMHHLNPMHPKFP